jgi:acyl-CoA thioester hydrolase
VDIPIFGHAMTTYSETLTTRWADNDIYGHVNNVAYYGFFDSVINRYLIQHGLDIHKGDIVGFMVASQCRYLKPVSYPEEVRIELAVEKLGNSSVTYALTLFNAAGAMAAEASMTHVFVDRDNNRSTPIPDHLRKALQALLKTR